MARIFITGSADGLGQMAAKLLVKAGHKVTLHARNRQRGDAAMAAVPGAEGVITGDLSSIAETKNIADEANRSGRFDAVIHNAGVGYQEPKRINTVDGLPHVFAINSLAPYILTCLVEKPGRLIYLSSGLHLDGDDSLKDLVWNERPWRGYNAYSDSKLHDAILAFAVGRKWPDVYANAMTPGWVATKMGGASAPDSLEDAPKTQVWLAVSDDKEALVSGKYFCHKAISKHHPAADDIDKQERLLAEFKRLSGIPLPA